MSGTTPEKDPSPEQKKPDETQTETTRIQATHTPKSKDESPDQNQQSQCQLRRPQQSKSKLKRKRTSEELGITSPDAVVYEPNQSDEQLLENVSFFKRPFEQKSEWMEGKFNGWNKSQSILQPGGLSLFSMPFEQKSEWMEGKFNGWNKSQSILQPGRLSANEPSQPDGSNPVQGNPPSRLGRRVKTFLCLRN